MADLQRYALVKDGATVNVIVWDGVSKYDPPEGHELIEESKAAAVRTGRSRRGR